MSNTALTMTERETLSRLEDEFEGVQKATARGARILMDIRDQRLYRADHGSFEAYCKERWGFGRSYASRLIGFATVSESVANWQQSNGEHVEPPATESHAREVGKVPAEQQGRVWKKAVDTAPKDKRGKPKVTAVHVSRVIEKDREELNPASNGHHEPAPEPNGHSEPDPVEPWQQTAADTLRIIGNLSDVADDMRQSYGASSKGSEKQLTFAGAKRYSWSGTVGVVNGLINYLHKEMPIGTDTKGVVTAGDKAKADAFAGSRGGR